MLVQSFESVPTKTIHQTKQDKGGKRNLRNLNLTLRSSCTKHFTVIQVSDFVLNFFVYLIEAHESPSKTGWFPINK